LSENYSPPRNRLPPKILVGALVVGAVLAAGGAILCATPIESSGGPTYDSALPERASDVASLVTSLMPTIISVVLLAASLWVILTKRYQPTDRHWAYGIVGTIIGYWLHT
jgi:mannose/fructose/N-acetylgalactosamine-specific phosphotransferase system component IID